MKYNKVQECGQWVQECTVLISCGGQVRQPSCEGHGTPPPLQKYTLLFTTNLRSTTPVAPPVAPPTPQGSHFCLVI